MLILTQLLKLKTLLIDFSNAFAQADMPARKTVYLQLPCSFLPAKSYGREMVLKLKKSLYGQAEALRLWYEKLKVRLKDRGFKTLQIDLCLFISKMVIVVAYVDDCLIFSKKNLKLINCLSCLKKMGMSTIRR